MIHLVGGLFGVVTIVCLLGLVARPALTQYNQDMRKKGKTLSEGYLRVYRWLIKNHRMIGIVAVLSVFLHFLLQLLFVSISVTGALAAALLAVQGGLGLFMARQKGEKRQKLAKAHRTVGVLILTGVVLHRIFPYAGIPRG